MEQAVSRWIKILFLLFFIAGLLAFLVSIGDLVKILIIAGLLAYILDPMVSFLESKGLTRLTATLIIFSGILFCIGLFLFLILPTLSAEIRAIQSGWQSGEARTLINNLEKFLQERFAFLGVGELNLMQRIYEFFHVISTKLFSYLLNAVQLITNLVIIPFIIFFLLKDGREIKKQFISLVPNRYFEFTLNVLHKMDLQLGNYLRGQFFDALIIGILSIIALKILGLKYFVIIGAFAGLANLIPYVGPIAGAIPAIIVSVMQTGGFAMILPIALAFALVQLIDNVIVQPLVVARTVNMHPLVVLLVVIIGGKFFGILGMLLSVPATGVLKVMVQETISNYRKYRFS